MVYVISLGGSIIVPEEINIKFLIKFKELILSLKERVIIVCGGGYTARKYIKSGKKITSNNKELDMLGIRSTKINAELVKILFGKNAYNKVISNPKRKVKFSKILVCSGGIVGSSSDYDATILAKTYNSKKIINLTNLYYVFDKDPKYKNAKPFEKLSWTEMRKIVGNEWKSGMNYPFDPIASKLAEKYNLEVINTKGTDIKNLKNIFSNKKFKGTIIS